MPDDRGGTRARNSIRVDSTPANGSPDALERVPPHGGAGAGLAVSYLRAKARVADDAARSGAADLRARTMWLLFDLATSAFRMGDVSDDVREQLVAGLGSVPVLFDDHTSHHAKALQLALEARRERRQAAGDQDPEPPLDLAAAGDGGQDRAALQRAGHRAGGLMLAVLESVPEYRLISLGADYRAPEALWRALLDFATGKLFVPLDPRAQKNFNCSPNGVSITLFAEYARAACEWSSGHMAFAGRREEQAKWRALWPAFVATIDAFNDCYQVRGAPRTIAAIGDTSERAGTNHWTRTECLRAKAYYEGLDDAGLLAQWRRLLRALDRDNPGT